MNDAILKSVNKSEWPLGPWQTEPDEKRWTDEATGLPCVVMRAPSGAWCGYVGVPEGHRAYGLRYHRYDYEIDDVLSGKAAAEAPIQKLVNDIRVHGGLTYGELDAYRGAGFYWFGFDCSHAGDFGPAYESITRLGTPTGWGENITYRDLQYAMEGCVSLALQLRNIELKSGGYL